MGSRAILLSPLLLLVIVSTGKGEPLQAGAARVDITPPVGYPMWGYAVRRDEPSLKVRDPLQARAIVLAVGKERLALVSLDLGRPPTRDTMKSLRLRVRRDAGIEHLFLVASHTHHGPVLELDDWPREGKPYVQALEDKLAGVIAEAARALQPARLGIAAQDIGLNRNRHSHRPDRPVDRQCIVVRLDTAAGKPLAHLVNFAAHPTMTDALVREFSADYPGHLARAVEAELGGLCLFLQGAAGDLSPHASLPATPQSFGAELAKHVIAQSRTITTSADVAALQGRAHDFTFGKRFDLDHPLLRGAFTLIFFKGLVDFYEREYRDGVRPSLTTVLLDGRLGIVGVSGEFFCEHALHLKRRARLEHLLFLGYCNDYQQYFPTIQAVAEGGYGADAAVSPAAIGAGERIMDQALIDLLEMKGKIRRAELPRR